MSEGKANPQGQQNSGTLQLVQTLSLVFKTIHRCSFCYLQAVLLQLHPHLCYSLVQMLSGENTTKHHSQQKRCPSSLLDFAAGNSSAAEWKYHDKFVWTIMPRVKPPLKNHPSCWGTDLKSHQRRPSGMDTAFLLWPAHRPYLHGAQMWNICSPSQLAAAFWRHCCKR